MTDATQTEISGNALTATAPTVETVGSNSEDSQSVEQRDKLSNNDKAVDSDEDTPLVDHNNPAKSTFQNCRRKIKGGPCVSRPSGIDCKKCGMHFCGAPTSVIEKTFKNIAWMGRKAAVKGMKLWRRHKAPNPALNIPGRNETVVNGSTAAQFFVGRKLGFCAVEGIGKSDKRFPVALMNHIRNVERSSCRQAAARLEQLGTCQGLG